MRFYDGNFMPSWIELTAALNVTDPTIGDDSIRRSFMKMDYFFDEIVNNSIAVTLNDINVIEFMAETTTNNIILLPSAAIDSHLAVIFAAKMNAIADHGVEFLNITLINDNLNIGFVGDYVEYLPSNEEWCDTVGEKGGNPWWHRCDSSTFDGEDDEDTDRSVFDFDFLFEEQNDSPAEIIKPKFRPTIVS
ncbi:MAG: hypothetical protein WC284_14715 [Candidimonas sp.]